jgi:hypothetical protein
MALAAAANGISGMTVGDRPDWLQELLDRQIADGISQMTVEGWWRRC